MVALFRNSTGMYGAVAFRAGCARQMAQRVVRGLLLVFASGIAALGCAPSAETKPAAPDEPAARQVTGGGQVIIKFRNPAVDPSNTDTLAALSATAGTPLEFVRPMSGGAFVLRAGGVTDPDRLAEVIRRLAARPDVESVEPDRVLRPMTSSVLRK